MPDVDGTILLNFDNYFSWSKNKNVSYRFEYEGAPRGTLIGLLLSVKIKGLFLSCWLLEGV